MLAEHPAILASLRSRGVRPVVMAHDEYTTDLPEQADMKPKSFWDRRVRGLGGPLASCAEENLLCYPGDPCPTEDILIHEFAHTILDRGLAELAPGFEKRLHQAYGKAMEAGLWKNTYTAENPHEYWAEAVQDWFDNNRQNDAQHNAVNTRAELRQYDPGLAAPGATASRRSALPTNAATSPASTLPAPPPSAGATRGAGSTGSFRSGVTSNLPASALFPSAPRHLCGPLRSLSGQRGRPMIRSP